jgi:hypothetical protein
VTEFGQIKNPAELDDLDSLGAQFGKLALRFAGLVFPPAAIASILVDHFDQTKLEQRLQDYYGHLLDRISVLEQKSLPDEVMAEAEKRFKSRSFAEGVLAGGEEAIRAVRPEKSEQFAAIAVGWLVPSQWGEHDVATMIRDIGQLVDSDIRVLGILAGVYGTYVNTDLFTNQVTVFTSRMGEQFAAVLASKINPDDFLSSCARLSGFGLVIEESRTPNDLRLAARCFRPTRRGMAVLTYLEAPEPR